LTITFSVWLMIGILVVLILIYSRINDIYRKLTERQRVVEEKRKRSFRRMSLEIEAWKNLPEIDKSRFNDFYYEHAVGKISDEEFEKMKEELRHKTNGILE
jgi:hypothetical protein